MTAKLSRLCSAVLFAGLASFPAGSASAQLFSFAPVDRYNPAFPQQTPQASPDDMTSPDDQQVPSALRRQTVAYSGAEAPGTVIIDTAHTVLYLTLGSGKAMRYGIGVGRDGFTWSGVETITRKAEWPDWIPPAQMVARQPYLPRWVGGGPGNPLGARALYLGHTDYRIHGTNDPTSIGKHVSSGCIRMQNADVIDLFQRVGVGTKVVVLAGASGRVSALDGRATPVAAQIPVRPAAFRPAASRRSVASSIN